MGRARSTVLSDALVFISGEFKPHFFWWELPEMFRRFLLVGLLSIVNPGSVVQLIVATTFCILYLVIQLLASPFRRLTDGFVGLCGSASLVLMFVSCIVMKLKTLTGTCRPCHRGPTSDWPDFIAALWLRRQRRRRWVPSSPQGCVNSLTCR
jgi:hypothetical protein